MTFGFSLPPILGLLSTVSHLIVYRSSRATITIRLPKLRKVLPLIGLLVRFRLRLLRDKIDTALGFGCGLFFQTFHLKFHSNLTGLIRRISVHSREMHLFQSGLSGSEFGRVSLFRSSE